MSTAARLRGSRRRSFGRCARAAPPCIGGGVSPASSGLCVLRRNSVACREKGRATSASLASSGAAMDVEDAIRTRRTHKAYTNEPVDQGTLDELFELARWAP